MVIAGESRSRSQFELSTRAYNTFRGTDTAICFPVRGRTANDYCLRLRAIIRTHLTIAQRFLIETRFETLKRPPRGTFTDSDHSKMVSHFKLKYRYFPSFARWFMEMEELALEIFYLLAVDFTICILARFLSLYIYLDKLTSVTICQVFAVSLQTVCIKKCLILSREI